MLDKTKIEIHFSLTQSEGRDILCLLLRALVAQGIERMVADH